ncbi:conserved protein of unknown function [Tenacibaculum sp. 190130A14a]|uniref:UPF0102 protein T190423A01A_20257 n=1 Tax=Tenacibaculum polynesiense TaxID=3137857 RepID=A0ABP1F2B3_9FLAO
MAIHNELGKKGEQIAVDFLVEKGFTIVERNYRFQKAEVDIIARKDELLLAVEVKTRSSIDFGDPQDFINSKKIKLLLSAIDYYVVEKNLDIEVRFDVIAVVIDKSKTVIEHIEDAFLYF